MRFLAVYTSSVRQATGLPSDSIKLDLKPYLQHSHVTVEELFEKLNGAVSKNLVHFVGLPQVQTLHHL